MVSISTVPCLTLFLLKELTQIPLLSIHFMWILWNQNPTYQTKIYTSFLYKKLTYEYLTFRLFCLLILYEIYITNMLKKLNIDDVNVEIHTNKNKKIVSSTVYFKCTLYFGLGIIHMKYRQIRYPNLVAE